MLFFSRAFLVRALVALLFAISNASRSEAAEATTGTIVGTVVTAAGEPIANAQITVASASGHYAVRTDAHGRFTVLGVTPDTYLLSVDAVGYAVVTQNGIAVLPAGRQSLTIHLTSLKT